MEEVDATGQRPPRPVGRGRLEGSATRRRPPSLHPRRARDTPASTHLHRWDALASTQLGGQKQAGGECGTPASTQPPPTHRVRRAGVHAARCNTPARTQLGGRRSCTKAGGKEEGGGMGGGARGRRRKGEGSNEEGGKEGR